MRLSRLVRRAAGPFQPTDKPVDSLYGPTYRMDINRDQFVHFAPEEYAQEIISHNKLLKHPPHKKLGPEDVFAVSTQWGKWLPTVQSTHIRSKTGKTVAVLFQTNLAPDYGYPEEVVWHTDVPFRKVKIISYAQAAGLLKRAPFRPPEESFQVTYSG